MKIQDPVWLLIVAGVLLLFTPVLVLAKSCTSGQPKTESALQQLEQNWAKALDQHDAETVACLVADEFEDAGVDGSVHNRAEMLAHIPQHGPNLNHLSNTNAHLYGDFAYVRGVNQVSDPSGKPVAEVRFTDIFVYRDGRWQAVAGQETLLEGGTK